MSGNWKLTLPCTRAEAEALYDEDERIALLDPAPTIVTQEVEAFNDAKWELLAYFHGKPGPNVVAALQAMVPSAAAAHPTLEELPDDDWLTMSQRGLNPVHAGRFYVHTSSNKGAVPDRSVPFLIDASQAFGTGGHETTSGCLVMLDWLKRRGKRFDHIVDIGTGTGILAFAANHLWRRAYVTASDIDPVSVTVTADNAVQNGVAIGQSSGRIALCVAPGTDHEMIQRRAPFDLVIANILAGPLIELAPSLADISREGGTLILAGLLDTQADAVRRAYRKQGFLPVRTIVMGDWPCLCLVKRRAFGWRRPVRADGRTSQPPGDFGIW